MSDLLDVQMKLLATSQELARLTARSLAEPGAAFYVDQIRSVTNRQEKLQRRFRELAADEGREVCSYRIIPERRNRLPAAGMAGVVGGFQELLSVTYEAVNSGIRSRGTVSHEAALATELDFSHATAGSIVLVFTAPNERDLFGSKVEEAVKAVFAASKANGATEVRAVAKKIGIPPIRALYRWAGAHAQFGLSVELSWRDGEEATHRVQVAAEEFRRLAEAIAATGDESIATETHTGKLVTASQRTSTFEIETEDKRTRIKGDAGDVLHRLGIVGVGGWYVAKVQKTTYVTYSTERETVNYRLLELTPAPPPPVDADALGE